MLKLIKSIFRPLMENKWQTKNGFNAQGIKLETSIQSIDS